MKIAGCWAISLVLTCICLPGMAATKADVSIVGRITGVVTEFETGMPVANATVMLLDIDKNIGDVSRLDGTYLIRSVPVGVYRLKIVSPNHETQVIDMVVLDSSLHCHRHISLSQSHLDSIPESKRVHAERVNASSVEISKVGKLQTKTVVVGAAINLQNSTCSFRSPNDRRCSNLYDSYNKAAIVDIITPDEFDLFYLRYSQR